MVVGRLRRRRVRRRRVRRWRGGACPVCVRERTCVCAYGTTHLPTCIENMLSSQRGSAKRGMRYENASVQCWRAAMMLRADDRAAPRQECLIGRATRCSVLFRTWSMPERLLTRTCCTHACAIEPSLTVAACVINQRNVAMISQPNKTLLAVFKHSHPRRIPLRLHHRPRKRGVQPLLNNRARRPTPLSRKPRPQQISMQHARRHV